MNWTGLAQRLEKKFGSGENPCASRKVYGHVERLCHTHGDPVYVIVCDMVAYAERAKQPGRTFRAFVLKRIQEHGFPIAGGGPNQTLEQSRAEKSRLSERIGHMPAECDPPGPKPSSTAASDAFRVREDELLRKIMEERAARDRDRLEMASIRAELRRLKEAEGGGL